MKNLPFGPVSYSVNAFNYKFTCYLVKLLKAKSRNCRSVKKVTLDVNILNVLYYYVYNMALKTIGQRAYDLHT